MADESRGETDGRHKVNQFQPAGTGFKLKPDFLKFKYETLQKKQRN